MPDTYLQPQTEHPLLAVAYRTTAKARRSRLTLFVEWQQATGAPWYAPDLAAYAQTLLEDGKTLNTVKSYVSTVRSAYRRLLRDNTVRSRLSEDVPEHDPITGERYSVPDRLRLVSEMLTRMQNAIDPIHTVDIKPPTQQDTPDDAHTRLTAEQVEFLIASPGVDDAPGLRDTALLVLAVCTGVRVGELVSVRVEDLRKTVGGELALLVREGKGGKQRMVPYGENVWCLQVVGAWLKLADIPHGPVFRGFYKPRKDGTYTIRDYALSTRAVEDIVKRYPVPIQGELRTIEPHDLRRTYARREFAAGTKLEVIRQNLGHEDIKTTQRYIGTLDAAERRPSAIYAFDLSQL
jgi:site-specific recombinase XerD